MHFLFFFVSFFILSKLIKFLDNYYFVNKCGKMVFFINIFFFILTFYLVELLPMKCSILYSPGPGASGSVSCVCVLCALRLIPGCFSLHSSHLQRLSLVVDALFGPQLSGVNFNKVCPALLLK